MALLEVRPLTKHFGGRMANDRVDLSREGEIVGLIGPNGAGKTTLFNCIAGFYPPTARCASRAKTSPVCPPMRFA